MCRIRLAPLVLVIAGVTPAASALDVTTLLHDADASRHVIDEGVVRIRAETSEDGKPVHESVIDVYVRGADHVLCVFREGSQKGRKVLVAGGRAWLIVPEAAKPIPISASQRLLGGASVADVARLRFSGFIAEARGDGVIDGAPCVALELSARVPKAPYASGRLWVGQQDHLPRRARLALRSGREAKELRFVDYDRHNGRTVLRRMEIEDLLSAKRKTVTTLEFLDYRAQPLAAELFEPAGARELR